MNNATAIPVENNVQSRTAVILPFRFETRDVRTILIDDQPWFCAADVCAVLEYANSRQAIQKNCRAKGVSSRDTLTKGGVQALTFIDEGNLYRLIIKSRKDEAQRFEAWVCDEVLPAIRKHGRYEDQGKMTKLMDQLSLSQLNVVKGVIRDKAKAVPTENRQGFQLVMHNRLHTRFNVSRTELIPASEFESACNFIASYALEGEFLPKQERQLTAPLDLDYPLSWLLEQNPDQFQGRSKNDELVVTVTDMVNVRRSPCLELLDKLNDAGYDIQGAFYELRSYQNIFPELRAALSSAYVAAQSQVKLAQQMLNHQQKYVVEVAA